MLAWQKIDELIASPSPVGWLFNTLKNVMIKIQAEQYRLQKHFAALEEMQTDVVHISDEVSPATLYDGIVSKDEPYILDKLYLQGYTYQESKQSDYTAAVPHGDTPKTSSGILKTRRYSRIKVRRMVVALVAMLLFGGMLTAQALGYNVFQALARWTEERFSTK